MIKRYQLKFPWHKLGSSKATEMPITDIVGDIVGIAIVPVSDGNDESYEKEGVAYVGFNDMKYQSQARHPISTHGKVTISTSDGDVLASCPLDFCSLPFNKRCVPVSFRKPHSRLCFVIEESLSNEIVSILDDEGGIPMLSYNIDVYIKTTGGGQ